MNEIDFLTCDIVILCTLHGKLKKKLSMHGAKDNNVCVKFVIKDNTLMKL